MPLPNDLHMRVAGEPDLARIAALRESVGWTAQDWALSAVLEAPDARCLVVEARDGIAGVGSGISYGALGFVGNMIVTEAHRRRGVGAAILEAILEFLVDERGSSRLELFATPSGRPLYGRYGFELTDPSAMVLLPRSTMLEQDLGVEIAEAGDLGELAAYDAPRFGGDRLRLLTMMADDPQRPLLVARHAKAIVGYAWLRTDGPRVGPFVADAPAVAATLLVEAFRRVPEAEELSLNLPTANGPGTQWLRELGMELEPWDGRMARGPQIPRRDETIYANLVGALG